MTTKNNKMHTAKATVSMSELPEEIQNGAKEAVKQYLATQGIPVIDVATTNPDEVPMEKIFAVNFENFNVYKRDWTPVGINPQIYNTFAAEARTINSFAFNNLEQNPEHIDNISSIIRTNIDSVVSCAFGSFTSSIENLYSILIDHINELLGVFSGKDNKQMYTIEKESRFMYFGDIGCMINDLLKMTSDQRMQIFKDTDIVSCVVYGFINNTGVGIYNDIRTKIANILSRFDANNRLYTDAFEVFNNQMATFMQLANQEGAIFIYNLENMFPFIPDIDDVHKRAPKMFESQKIDE